MTEIFRQDLISFFAAIDSHGCFTDSDRRNEGIPPMTFAEGVELAVDSAKYQIQHDVSTGTVPATVPSFAALHDYVDANGYGCAFDWPWTDRAHDEEWATDFWRFWNEVQNGLDAWIKSGALSTENDGCLDLDAIGPLDNPSPLPE